MSKKSIWHSNPQSYTKLRHSGLRDILHPAIISIINDHEPRRLLDIGCGNGLMLESVSKGLDLSIFDISQGMLSMAAQRLADRDVTVYRKWCRIPGDHYDIVSLSMVLVCIADKEEYKNVLSNTFRCLRAGGLGIFAVTHPCFRNYPFCDFHTSYLNNESNYDYFRESEPFEVTIQDHDSEESISFEDYHYSLSFMINAIIEVGFRISRISELKDNTTALENSNKSPFIIIEGEKT